MSQPGTKSPRNTLPKSAEGCTKLPLDGGKPLTVEKLDFCRGEVASKVGTAPTSRVYTRDYSKVGREEGDEDLVTAALGRNPFRI